MLTVSPWQQYFVLLAKLWPPCYVWREIPYDPHTYPQQSFEINAVYYLLSQYHRANESSIWNHTRWEKKHAGIGIEKFQSSIIAQSAVKTLFFFNKKDVNLELS